jgi:hypothetical protein
MAKSEHFPSLSFTSTVRNGVGCSDTASVPLADGVHGSVTLICGDMFVALEQFVSDPFDIVYDRHSFGAIPPDMRPRYARTISAVLRKSSAGSHPSILGSNALYFMQVAHRRDANVSAGPPYHVNIEEVQKQFSDEGVASGIQWSYGFLPSFSADDEVGQHSASAFLLLGHLTLWSQVSHPLMKVMKECVIYGILPSAP